MTAGPRETKAPYPEQRIWVAPLRITRVLRRGTAARFDFSRADSGRVIGGDWDLDTRPLMSAPKVAACHDHFERGLSWEDTGIIETQLRMIEKNGQADHCRTRADLIARYASIDALYHSILAKGFQTRQRLRARDPVEPDGVYIHIARDGTPIFGVSGNHRLGIARALRMRVIPAMLGVVHADAFASGIWEDYTVIPQQMLGRGGSAGS